MQTQIPIPQLTTEQQERVRLFVAALRSGKYRQTKYTLSRYDKPSKRRKYCAMGVACEVARLAGVELSVTRDDMGYFAYDGREDAIPESVQTWYGFRTVDPVLKADDADEGATTTALTLNEGRNSVTFSEIAKAFERTYLTDSNSNPTSNA